MRACRNAGACKEPLGVNCPRQCQVSENSLLSFLTARELDVVSILHVEIEVFVDGSLELHRAHEAGNAPAPE